MTTFMCFFLTYVRFDSLYLLHRSVGCFVAWSLLERWCRWASPRGGPTRPPTAGPSFFTEKDLDTILFFLDFVSARWLRADWTAQFGARWLSGKCSLALTDERSTGGSGICLSPARWSSQSHPAWLLDKSKPRSRPRRWWAILGILRTPGKAIPLNCLFSLDFIWKSHRIHPQRHSWRTSEEKMKYCTDLLHKIYASMINRWWFLAFCVPWLHEKPPWTCRLWFLELTWVAIHRPSKMRSLFVL